MSLIASILWEGFTPSRHEFKEDPPPIYALSRIPLSCLDAKLPAIDEEKSINALLSAFRSCDSEFKKTFGQFQSLSEGLRFGAFMALVASKIKPYGTPDAVDFNAPDAEIIKNVLSQKAIECDTAAHLITASLRLAHPELKITHLGVGSASINHVMVLATDDSGSLLLDPTTSVVAQVEIDKLLKGNPVPAHLIIDYYTGHDEHLEMFRRLLRGSLLNGAIREQDLLYRESKQ